MLGLIARWAAPFVALLLARYLFPDRFLVEDLGAAAVFALVLALLNAFVKPVVAFFSLPITCLTLGLFHFVLNAIFFAVAAALVPGVSVDGFLSALVGALIVSAVSLVASMVAR